MGVARRHQNRAAAERRIVECWLPLAAEANRVYNWQLEPTALERLVRRSVAALRESSTPFEVRAVLWGRYVAGYHL